MAERVTRSLSIDTTARHHILIASFPTESRLDFSQSFPFLFSVRLPFSSTMSTSYELDTFQRAPSSKHSISSISSLSLPSTPLPAIINHSHTTLSLELDHNPPSTSSSFPEPEASEEIPFIPALPPVDSGHEAWLFLISATLIETLVWGLPFSVGILNVYWTQTLFKGYGGSTVALAATLQTGLMYMSTGLLGPFVNLDCHVATACHGKRLIRC